MVSANSFYHRSLVKVSEHMNMIDIGYFYCDCASDLLSDRIIQKVLIFVAIMRVKSVICTAY